MSCTGAVTVRAAGLADLNAVVELVHASFAQYRGRLVPESGALRETAGTLRERLARGAAFLALDGDRLVGCVFVHEHEGAAYVGRLAVRPDERGRGIARALVEAALDWGRERGFAEASCGVRLALPENAGFFASLGFRPVELGFHDGIRNPTFLWLRRPLEAAR